MTRNFRQLIYNPSFKDPQSGYELKLYVLGGSRETRANRTKEIRIFDKVLVLEITCPADMDINAFVERIKRFEKIPENLERKIRNELAFSLILADNKSGKVERNFQSFAALAEAGIALGEAAKKHITDIMEIADLDPHIPMRGRECILRGGRKRLLLQR